MIKCVPLTLHDYCIDFATLKQQVTAGVFLQLPPLSGSCSSPGLLLPARSRKGCPFRHLEATVAL